MDTRQNRCPDCGSPLGIAPGPRCPRCGLPLTGPQAVELWHLDRTLADLAARRTALLHRRGVLIAALRARRTAPGAPANPAPAPHGGPLAAPHGAPPGVPWAMPRPDAPALSVQTVLLVLGGVLTSVAGLVFTVVNWGHLGVAGRAAVLTVLTGLAFTAHLTLRRRLAATAETAASVGLALVLLDCYAARAAGLAGLDRLPADGYFTAVAALAGAAAWAYGRGLRSTALQWGALLLAQGTVVLAAATADAGRAGWGMFLVAGAALDLASALVLRGTARPGPALARAASVAGAVWAVAGGAVAGTVLLGAGPGDAYGPVLDACVPLAVLALLGTSAARHGELPHSIRVLAGAVAGVALVAVVAGGPRVGLPAEWTVTAHAVPAAALAVLALGRLAASGPGARRHPLWAGAAVAGAVVLGAAVLQVLPELLRALGEPLRQTLTTAGADARWHVGGAVPAVAVLLAVTAGTAAFLLSGNRLAGAGLSGNGLPGAPQVPPTGGPLAPAQAAEAAKPAQPGQPVPPGEPAPAVPRTPGAASTGPAQSAGSASTAGPGRSLPSGHSAPPAHPVQPADEARLLAWGAAVVVAVVAAVAAFALAPVAAGLPYGVALAAAWLPAPVAAAFLVRRPDAGLVPKLCAVVTPVALALVWSLPHDTAALAVWGATAALGAGLAAGLHGPGPRWIAEGAAAFSVIALGVEAARAGVTAGLPAHLAAFAVLGAAVAAVPVAARLRSTAVEAAGYGVAAAALLMTIPHRDAASVALAVAGAAALGVALRAERRGAAVPAAVVLLTLASWLRLSAAGVTAPEPYVAPVAVAALLLGHLHRRRFPQAGSWPAYGPGLGFGLLPGLGAAWADVHWLRPLLLGVVALAVTLAGARHRLRAPLMLGGAVLTADAVHELAPAIAQSLGLLPRWAPLAAAGLLLLFLGATYEQRLADGRRLRDRLRRLT